MSNVSPTNKAYWRKRFEILEQSSNAYAKQAIRKIDPAFAEAERKIDAEITAWYQRFADNNEITMQEARKLLNSKELAELKWDVETYIQYGEKNALDGLWMKELENASAKFHISRLEALKLRTQQAAEVAFGNELDEVDSLARKVLTEGYYHTAFELQKGVGVGWDIGTIDNRKLDKLLTTPWTTDGKTFSDRIWTSKQQLIGEVHNSLTRTCILGKAPDDAIKTISKKFGVSKSQAGRLVMTEQAYFHSVSQKEAFADLGVEQFEIVATLDSHTSEICQDMDGEHFDMKDYEPGVTAPPFHPWCRSVTCPYFDDDFGSVGERAARDEESGKTYYVPANTTYHKWKEAFVDGGSKKDFTASDVLETVLSEKEIDKRIKELRKEQKELSDYGTYDEVVNTWGSVDEWFGDEPEKERFIETQKEIEKLLAMKPGVSVIGGKTRGANMNITDALQGANPNFSQGGQYRVNCQRCVQTYEYRRRGFDVEALPKPKRGGKIKWGNECFVDKQGNVPQFTYNQTEKQIKDELTKAPDNARYIIYIKWSTSRTAHVFIAEKENGIIRYVDPQSAKDDVSDYFSRGVDGKYGFLRIDDKDITKDMSLIKATMK
jgi:SPP1 gp7 family putative phage head morphogenesis protein